MSTARFELTQSAHYSSDFHTEVRTERYQVSIHTQNLQSTDHPQSAELNEASFIPGEFCEVDLSQGDCFNIDACCDSTEKACIETLRAYLRPQEAPDCLISRLKTCLDSLCEESSSRA